MEISWENGGLKGEVLVWDILLFVALKNSETRVFEVLLLVLKKEISLDELTLETLISTHLSKARVYETKLIERVLIHLGLITPYSIAIATKKAEGVPIKLLFRNSILSPLHQERLDILKKGFVGEKVLSVFETRELFVGVSDGQSTQLEKLIEELSGELSNQFVDAFKLFGVFILTSRVNSVVTARAIIEGIIKVSLPESSRDLLENLTCHLRYCNEDNAFKQYLNSTDLNENIILLLAYFKKETLYHLVDLMDSTRKTDSSSISLLFTALSHSNKAQAKSVLIAAFCPDNCGWNHLWGNTLTKHALDSIHNVLSSEFTKIEINNFSNLYYGSNIYTEKFEYHLNNANQVLGRMIERKETELVKV